MDLQDKIITFDNITIDFKKRTITWKDTPQKISGGASWVLLEKLISKSPQLLDYKEIKNILWPDDKTPKISRICKKGIQVKILELRKAIHDDSQQIIVSTRGKGYTFAVRFNILDAESSGQSRSKNEALPSVPITNHVSIRWTDGTTKSIKIHKVLADEEGKRKYYLFVLDDKWYCAQIQKDSAGKETWQLILLADWIDLAIESRKKQLNMEKLLLEDCDRLIYEYAAKQKERLDQIFVDYPQIAQYFNGKASTMPTESQKEMCFSLATIIGSYFHDIIPILSYLPYHYACSILDWEQKVLSSPIMETAVSGCSWFWEFIY